MWKIALYPVPYYTSTYSMYTEATIYAGTGTVLVGVNWFTLSVRYGYLPVRCKERFVSKGQSHEKRIAPVDRNML